MKNIVLCGCMIALLLLFVPASFSQAQEPIRIGFIFVKSGNLMTFGTMAEQGGQLAIGQINDRGGVIGRKLIGIFKDSKGDPAVGAEQFRKLVTDDRVDVVVGPSLGSVAEAISPLANRMKVPLIVPVALNPDITGKDCNSYTFRISQNLSQNIKSAAIIASGLKATNWSTIGPDYTYGHQAWEFFQKYLRELKPDASFLPSTKVAFVPPDTGEWGSHIDKVIESKPDAVLITLFGKELITFVRQARDKGFFDQGYDVLMNLGGSIEVLFALKHTIPNGVWLGTPYWFQSDVGGPSNHNFVAAYRTRYKTVPSWVSEGAYAGVMAYVEACKVSGSTAKDGVIAAMEGLTLRLPTGEISIRAEDHQAITPAFWGTSARDDAFRFTVLHNLKVMPGKNITPDVAETGCRMKR
jgi:branched-chain amino acid transport system substrate-binding protein